MTDLFEDIKDGVMLLALLEVLSGQKLVSLWVISTSWDLATSFKHVLSSDLSGLYFLLSHTEPAQADAIKEKWARIIWKCLLTDFY